MAARAFGLQAIDGPYLGIRDDEGLRVRAERVRALGFDGKWAVHPGQIEAINEAFTPTSEEFERARAVIDALEQAAGERGARRRGAGRRDGGRGEPQARAPDRGPRPGRRAGVSGAVSVSVAGPWFEDFERGTVFSDAPGLTLTPGHAALHQAVAGDRLRLALDSELCRAVTGDDRLLAHPNLVCDVAIGQSTGPTQRVRGNLFYRGLVLERPVFVGETLRTRTEVVALKQNRRREDGVGRRAGRAPDPDHRRSRESRCSTSGAAR